MDGDGVCDHISQHACVDEDGDGVCDFMQNGVCPVNGANCSQFVDEDGDGICDNHQQGGYCGRYNSGNAGNANNNSGNTTLFPRQGLGHHQGQGRGCGWCR